ncbi:VOC family protein [Streptomyces sp. NPDC002004]
MPEVTAPYAPGTPCWVDLMAQDQRAALDFYGDLFGWRGEPGPAEFGGYAIVEKYGKPVCGIGPAMAPEGQPEPPHLWTTYLSSDDADASAERIKAAGGTILFPPMDVGTLGRMAVAADPGGAVFGVWGHKEFFGARLVNEPGALIWNDCQTRDVPLAAAFYRSAFDLEARHMPEIDGHGLIPKGGDHPVAGLREMGGDFPSDVPAHWLTCFAVTGLDGTLTRHGAGGGEITVPPMESPYGRLAVLRDPWGAVFSVMELAEG